MFSVSVRVSLVPVWQCPLKTDTYQVHLPVEDHAHVLGLTTSKVVK